MLDKSEGKGWGTGKILAVVIPLCVAVIAVAVILVVVLGKHSDDSGQATATSQDEEPTLRCGWTREKREGKRVEQPRSGRRPELQGNQARARLPGTVRRRSLLTDRADRRVDPADGPGPGGRKQAGVQLVCQPVQPERHFARTAAHFLDDFHRQRFFFPSFQPRPRRIFSLAIDDACWLFARRNLKG